jgi:hypothetical protein
VYYRFLARAILAPGGREMWQYHRDGLRELGFPISRRRLAGALLRQVRQVLLSPGTEVPKVVRLLHRGGEEDANWRHWWAPTGFEAVQGVAASRPRADVEPAQGRAGARA